jgi:hypothetical protein
MWRETSRRQVFRRNVCYLCLEELLKGNIGQKQGYYINIIQHGRALWVRYRCFMGALYVIAVSHLHFCFNLSTDGVC